MWKLRQPTLAVVLALATSVGSAWAFGPAGSCRLWRDRPVTRQQLTAAFLYRLAQFVDWPVDAPREPFVIGILHDDNLAGALEAVVAGKTIDGRPFEVCRLESSTDLLRCQIAYLGPGESTLWPDLLARAVRSHVLTISDAPGFARHGGVITLVPDGCELRFEINTDTASCSGLRISSKLLTLATLVGDEPR